MSIPKTGYFLSNNIVDLLWRISRKDWGDKCYGWMPYEFVLNNLAMDFWSLLGMDWVDSG